MVFEKEGADHDQDQDQDQYHDHDEGHDHGPEKERHSGKDHTKPGKKKETVDDMIVTLSPMEIRAFILEVVYQ